MHGAAMQPNAGCQGARMGIQPRKGRQQGRVDIDQPPFPAPHEIGGQHAHEASERDDFNAMPGQFRFHGSLKTCPVALEGAAFHHGGGHPPRRCSPKPRSIGAVGKHQHRVRRVIRPGCLQNRRHIGPAPGNQQGEPRLLHARGQA